MQTFAVILLLWLALLVVSWWAHSRWPARAPSPRGLLAGLLLALAAWGFFWRILTGDAFMPADGGDMASYLLPMYRFAQESLRAGEWPLWNPHVYGGAPFVGDPQAGLFYPVNLVVWLLLPGPLDYAPLQTLSVLHILWAGLGTALCLRDGVSRMAALFGALAFMFSDLFIIHFGNLNLIAVAAWFPWAFWAYERACTRRQWRWAALAGVFLGVGALAGHPQMTLFSGLALALHAALRAALSPAWQRDGLWLGGTLLLMGAVAVGLAAVALVPALELAAYTERAAWRYGQTVGYSLSPAQWLGLLVPGFFGRSPQFEWSLWPRVEVGYVGVLTLALAAFAVAMRPDRQTGRVALLGGLAMLVALGVYSVAHGWLTAMVPGLAQLRAPARFIFVFDFAVVWLAARGLDALGSGAPWQGFTVPWRWLQRLVYLAWGVVLPLGYATLVWSQTVDATLHLRASVMLIALVFFAVFLVLSVALIGARRRGWLSGRAFAVLALALVYVDLASLGAYNDISDTDPSAAFHDHDALIAYLRDQPEPLRVDSRTDIDRLWQPDMALYHGLEDVGGIAHPLMLAAPARYWEALGSRSARLYDFLNVAYVIAAKDVTLDWDKFELAFADDPRLNLYRNRAALPRAFAVYEAVAVESEPQAWAAMQAADFDPAVSVVVEGGAPLAGNGPAAAVHIIERGPNHWLLEVTTTGAAYLVMSEVWFPGWQATVNGQNAPALRANGAFRAVFLAGSGPHRVRLWYAPASLRRGGVISGATMLILVAAAVWTWRRQSSQ